MKRLVLLLLLTAWMVPGISQIYDPVTWEFTWESKGKNEYEVVLRAIIEEKSHVYAMNLPEGGPIPTTVQFEPSSDYELVGEVYEKGLKEDVFDEAFKMDI
ncbi:MAG: thiol:disulfide interchange protein, partial [Bacteroidetes bacterium]|nr:thiol:disulfide interchange protein [Bacteroidota bacterium]